MEKLDRSKVILGGTPVDLMEPEPALERIIARATDGAGLPPLGVASVNLDHLHHFGTGGRWAGTLHADPASGVDWLYLLDGAPLVSQSQRHHRAPVAPAGRQRPGISPVGAGRAARAEGGIPRRVRSQPAAAVAENRK